MVSIRNRKDETIADNGDVMRILGMNSYLTKEKSKVLKESGKTTIIRVLWALKEHVAGQPNMAVPHDIPTGMRDIVQKMQLLLQSLKANMDQVAKTEDLSAPDQRLKDYLSHTSVRIRNAVTSYLVGKLTNYEVAESLNIKLFERRVPIWVFSKLTGQKLNLSQKGFEFRHILFPKDPSKGLCLSFKEIRDLGFVRAQGETILRAAYLAHVFMSENIFISSFCNVEDVEDEETMKLLANVPVLIPEPEMDYEKLKSNLAEQGLRQYSWPVGYAVSSKDNLQFLGTVFKRASVVAITRPQYQVLLIESLFAGFTYDANNRAANIFQQLKTTGDTSFRANVISGIATRFDLSQDARKAVRDLLVAILEISPQDNFRLALVDTTLRITHAGDFITGTISWVIPAQDHFDLEHDTWGPISAAANAVDVANPAVVAFNQSVTPQTGPKKEKKTSLMRETVQVRTILTTEALKVLRLTKSLHYGALIPVLTKFFQAFLTQAIQAQVAQLMLARMAAVLAKPAKLARNDLVDILDLDAVTALTVTLGDDTIEAEDLTDDENGEDEDEDDVPAEEVVG
jgi:hypothetical protein